MTRLRPLAMLVAFVALSAAVFGGGLLRHAGLSILATDLIQFACAALAVFLVTIEIRVQLARERAVGVRQRKPVAILAIAGTALSLLVWLVLVIGRNR